MTTLTENNGNGASHAEPVSNSETYCPRFDIWEQDDELVLYGDMPGVSAEDLDIQYDDGQLTIHAKTHPRYDGVTLSHGEYGIGDYHRSFTVGEAIDAEKIAAELKHGVLTLRLPKTEAVKPRKIEVKSG